MREVINKHIDNMLAELGQKAVINGREVLVYKERNMVLVCKEKVVVGDHVVFEDREWRVDVASHTTFPELSRMFLRYD